MEIIRQTLNKHEICDVCATFLPTGSLIWIAGASKAAVCNKCKTKFCMEVKKQKNLGKKLIAPNIAKDLYRKLGHEINSRTINDVPDYYWDLLRRKAARERSTIRKIHMKAIHSYCAEAEKIK